MCLPSIWIQDWQLRVSSVSVDISDNLLLSYNLELMYLNIMYFQTDSAVYIRCAAKRFAYDTERS